MGRKRKPLSGSALEKAAEDWLIGLGYTTHRVKASRTMRGNKDLFGCLDVLAFKHSHVVGLQCGVKSHRANKRKAIDGVRWPPLWMLYVCWCEVNDGDHVLWFDRYQRDGWEMRQRRLSLAENSP